MVVPLPYILGLSVALFALGAIGVLIRRNILIILMCLEMMLNAVNLAFIGFADHFKAVDGQMFVFFVLTVAAAEVAVGLALVMAIFRQRATVYVDDLNTDPECRSKGYGKLLMDWLKKEAKVNGCSELHLDSGVQREQTHRFYFREHLTINCYHFRIAL